MQLVEVRFHQHQRFLVVGTPPQKFPVGVEDRRAAPEIQPVLVADTVGVRHKGGEQTGIRPVDMLHPAGRFEFLVIAEAAPRRGGGENQQVGAVQPEQVGRRGVPEILANGDAHPSETGIESANGIAPGEESPLVEQPVGRQVNLVVDVQHLPASEVSRGDEKAVAAVLIHEADHQVEAAAGFQQGGENRVLGGGMVGDLSRQILEGVAGQREFGENQQVSLGGAGLPDVVEVLFQVRGRIAEGGVDLGESDVHEG